MIGQASWGITHIAEFTQGLLTMPDLPVAIACFDESGKFSDTKIVSVGGCIGYPQVLNHASKLWANRLGADGISHTSMKEAIHLHGPFDVPEFRQNLEKRDKLIRDLSTILIEAPMYRIAAALQSKAFKALSQQDRKKMRNDPHYAAVEGCISGALSRVPGYSLHIFFDLSEQYSEECVRLFHLVRKDKQDAKARCVGVTFSDDTAHPGLQMADMVAYCARAYETRDLVRPTALVEELIARFNSQPLEVGVVLYKVSGKGIGDAEVHWGQDALSSSQ